MLTPDVPEDKLEAGDVGTAVHIHNDGAGYEVEFMTLDGQTVAVGGGNGQSAAAGLDPGSLARGSCRRRKSGGLQSSLDA